MPFRSAAILCTLLLCSCTVTRPRSSAPVSDDELLHHPQVLLNPSFSPDQVRLWGVSIGDPVSAITPERIRDHGGQGWIWCRDGCRYRVQDGVIVALGLWDRSAIDKLNLTSPAEIEARFGPTSTIDLAEPLRIYRYHQGRLAVIWNDREQQVNAINISR